MILFEFNDVFAQFSDAIKTRFGKTPEEMTQAEYDTALGKLVKTDFYHDLAEEPLGIDLLKWAFTFGDKQAVFILVNEAKSPLWVNSQKIDYVDAFCERLGFGMMDFSMCNKKDLKGHAHRGPLITRNKALRILWDSAGQFKSVFLENDPNMTHFMIEESFKTYYNGPGMYPIG